VSIQEFNQAFRHVVREPFVIDSAGSQDTDNSLDHRIGVLSLRGNQLAVGNSVSAKDGGGLIDTADELLTNTPSKLLGDGFRYHDDSIGSVKAYGL
jgi:hypothetical protein